ncbi:hypothetical protein B0H13DRAFT_1936146 [Mycena leptocephala]|nr:hypothetical protein B0H13DRAFT_1936146 [Mycena leptocephala]
MPSLTIFLSPGPHMNNTAPTASPRIFLWTVPPRLLPTIGRDRGARIALPTNLVDQWTEFHRDILPLLVVPQIDDSADPRELYAAWCRLSVVGRVSDIVPGPHTCVMRKAHGGGHIFSRGAAIELKINVNMVSTLYAYLGSIASQARPRQIQHITITWSSRDDVPHGTGLYQQQLWSLPATTISPSSSSEGRLGIHKFSASKEILTPYTKQIQRLQCCVRRWTPIFEIHYHILGPALVHPDREENVHPRGASIRSRSRSATWTSQQDHTTQQHIQRQHRIASHEQPRDTGDEFSQGAHLVAGSFPRADTYTYSVRRDNQLRYDSGAAAAQDFRVITQLNDVGEQGCILSLQTLVGRSKSAKGGIDALQDGWMLSTKR